MPADEIGTFMAAIRQFESGGNYLAVGPETRTLGRALGAYQIMSANWASWATQAGIPGADWRDPEAQDTVARYKMLQYFNTYGDWSLVAIAWFAGPGNANKAQAGGIESVAGLSDILGTTVARYVENIRSLMGEVAPVHGVGPGPDFNTPVHAESPEEPDPHRRPAHQILAALFGKMSDAIAGGERIPIDQIVLAEPRELPEPPSPAEESEMENNPEVTLA